MEENNQNQPNTPPVQSSPGEQVLPPPVKNSSPKSRLKLSVLIAGVVLFFIFIGTALATFLFVKKTPIQTACTMDAKICPDGSSVGRSGPKCEFSPCPIEKTTTPAVTCTPRPTCLDAEPKCLMPELEEYCP